MHEGIAAFTRNERGGFGLQSAGFRGLGDVGVGQASAAQTTAAQAALNKFPSSMAKLVVDGIWGSKSIARLREFQAAYGLPVTGQLDSVSLQSLGIGGAAGAYEGGTVTGSAGLTDAQRQAVIDRAIAQTNANEAYTRSQAGLTPNQQSIYQDLLNGFQRGLNPFQLGYDLTHNSDAIKVLKKLANAGGDAAIKALEALAENGDIFAKLALALGVGLATAEIVAIAGGGLLVILLLKK